MIRCFAAVLLGLMLLGSADAKPPPNQKSLKPAIPEARHIYAEGNKLVKLADNLSLSALVGKSPWLIMASGGAYRYLTVSREEREQLGVFAQPWFWGTVWVLILLVAMKDTLLSWAGWLKVPLNALAELFHTSGGLVGYLLLGSIALDGLASSAEPAVNLAAATATPATLPSHEAAFSLVNFVLMSIVHTAVWIVFNTVEVAIIVSPFPFVDLVLKSGRTVLIGVITGAATIHPLLGFAIAAPIVLGCFLMIPVALRVTGLGWVFTWDILKRLYGVRRQATPTVPAFAAWKLGAPLLAYGTLSRNADHQLVFSYRRLLVLWKVHLVLPSDAVLGIGTLNPCVICPTADGGQRLLLRLPPGYAGCEAELAQQLGLPPPVDVSVSTSLKQFLKQCWQWLTGSARQAAPPETSSALS